MGALTVRTLSGAEPAAIGHGGGEVCADRDDRPWRGDARSVRGIGFGTQVMLNDFRRAGEERGEMTAGGGASLSGLRLQVHAYLGPTDPQPGLTPRARDRLVGDRRTRGGGAEIRQRYLRLCPTAKGVMEA